MIQRLAKTPRGSAHLRKPGWEQGCRDFKMSFFCHGRAEDWKATNGASTAKCFLPLKQAFNTCQKIKVPCTVTVQQPRMSKSKQRGVTPNTTCLSRPSLHHLNVTYDFIKNCSNQLELTINYRLFYHWHKAGKIFFRKKRILIAIAHKCH